ncbi:MAG: hypothetical protein US86_C0006G0051 [Candidatus Daviesbacteria bacterium GW2011_GWA2_38_24]|uniref:Glycosyltransferase n=1 Tax=Candidatus Daviesbacteria bacterium GW2011_GWA2_38_24 TaxID=1618422 RepID=A0A0G0MN97_9BACT|nr:MAG: hypothetical protein US86_C0006G0051 [Candidatus Daviesbacteria bacterium GW2011_GWA2_38_24]
MKIIHIITGLNVGGAEMMLYKVLQHSHGKEFQHEVISLTDVGLIGEKIQKLGVPVRALYMRGIDLPIVVIRLAFWLRSSNPDVVQTWMYHADLVGGLATKLGFLHAPIIWGIRQTNLHPKLSKLRTRFVARLSAFLSRWIPTKILCNSNSGRETHIRMGYDKKKMLVIPNGFDVLCFHQDKEARISVRKELGISTVALLIGYIARFDSQKDHRTFVEAARIFNTGSVDIHFVLCGRGVSWSNKELVLWIEKVNLKDNFHLLGEREDIPRITAALDVASLTSAYGEGFPNTVGEAMACGVPCVVTDAGDSAYIVGDTGFVVSSGDPVALANALRQMIEMKDGERQAFGKRARKRIEENFSIDQVVKKYIELYTSLV